MYENNRFSSKMRKGILLIILFLVFTIPVAAQTTTPIDFTGFTGSGFATNPSAGQLDSDIWRVTGLTDGDGVFGGTHTASGGDFARGSTTGGVTTGGVYAFDHSGVGDVALGVQPTGTDFTPGSITLLVTNNTGTTVSDVFVAYEIWTYNDQPRSNSLNFSWSLDDSSYTSVSALNYATPGAADALPTWQVATRSTTITGINLADGASIYLQWTGAEISGSGMRDEYGIDDIEVRVDGPTALTISTFIGQNIQNTQVVLLVCTIALLLLGGLFILRRNKAA